MHINELFRTHMDVMNLTTNVVNTMMDKVLDIDHNQHLGPSTMEGLITTKEL